MITVLCCSTDMLPSTETVCVEDFFSRFVHCLLLSISREVFFFEGKARIFSPPSSLKFPILRLFTRIQWNQTQVKIVTSVRKAEVNLAAPAYLLAHETQLSFYLKSQKLVSKWMCEGKTSQILWVKLISKLSIDMSFSVRSYIPRRRSAERIPFLF